MSDVAIDEEWFSNYLGLYLRALLGVSYGAELVKLKNRVISTNERGGKVLIAGNGGSAAIADHCAVDFTKNAGIRTLSFAGASWVSCLANDYGYDQWVARSLEMHADHGDLVVLVSSSGASENILCAARTARRLGLYCVTLSGFAADNPLRSMGDLSFYVDSRAYNVVEMTHQILLLAVCDAIIGGAEYSSAGVHRSRKLL